MHGISDFITYQWRIQDFPLGAPTHWGEADLRHVCFLAKTFAKMKELYPVGGGGGCRRSTNGNISDRKHDYSVMSTIVSAICNCCICKCTCSISWSQLLLFWILCQWLRVRTLSSDPGFLSFDSVCGTGTVTNYFT